MPGGKNAGIEPYPLPPFHLRPVFAGPGGRFFHEARPVQRRAHQSMLVMLVRGSWAKIGGTFVPRNFSDGVT